ncbi:MAG: Uma2 family endonuclease [Gemmataceae bacterium]|nr:Uma2 family endonuclease [Gemmataceae bacterium]
MSALTIPTHAPIPAAPPVVPAPAAGPASAPAGPDEAPHPLRWTLEEYYRLAEDGYFDGRKVMLIEGEVFVMSPMKDRHAKGVVAVMEAVRGAFGTNFTYRPQMPLELGGISDPEPDVAVILGPFRVQPDGHPRSALLVVEVADSSLAYDTGAKASLYAAGGIADYWVVDLVHNRVHVFRDPQPDPVAPHGADYLQRTTVLPGGTIVPLAAPNATAAVADLLP